MDLFLLGQLYCICLAIEIIFTHFLIKHLRTRIPGITQGNSLPTDQVVWLMHGATATAGNEGDDDIPMRQSSR